MTPDFNGNWVGGEDGEDGEDGDGEDGEGGEDEDGEDGDCLPSLSLSLAMLLLSLSNL